jgi:phosphate transport system protein
MSEHLRREIDLLKQKLLAMSAVVEASVANATRSIVERDINLANAVIKSDIDIDEMEVEIEEDCLKILALHQPVAIDLRFIIAVLKINSDLERVGDLAVNIAERSAYLSTQEKICMPFDFSGMTSKVQKMLTHSIDSLVNLDTRLAHRVRATDDEIDAINRDMYQMVKEELVSNPEQTNCLLHSLSVGRHLERIADHATNIAEDVVYLVDANIVRHQPEIFEE